MDVLASTSGALGGLRIKPYKGGQMRDGSNLEPGTSYRLLVLFPEKNEWEVFRLNEEDGRRVAASLQGVTVGSRVDVAFDPRKFGDQPYRAVDVVPVSK